MFDYEKIQSKRQMEIKPLAIGEYFDLQPGVISLGLGEPDFITPKIAREAGMAAISHGQTSYPPADGILELREATSLYLAEKFRYHYGPSEILITVGGSLALDCAMRAFIDQGDQVIIPTPAFCSYDPTVRLAGGQVVSLPTRFEDGFKLRPEALAAALTPRTKMVVLTSPNNPTGVTYTDDEFAALAAVLRPSNALVLTDEIYAEISYNRRHSSILQQEGMRERALLVSGFSKVYAMTGWRLGYICAPAPLLQPVAKVHAISVMCASSIPQYAAAAGLAGCELEVAQMVGEYDRRRVYVMQRLERLGWDCLDPGGAFYVFPRISSTGLDSTTFCRRLRDEGQVALIPGPAFGPGGEGFVRISYAYSMATLEEAFDRIEAFCSRLQQLRRKYSA